MSESQDKSSNVAGKDLADYPLGHDLLHRYSSAPGVMSPQSPSHAGTMAAGFSINRTRFLASVLRRWAGVTGPTADWAALVDRWPHFGRERNPIKSPITSSTNRPIGRISPRESALPIASIADRGMSRRLALTATSTDNPPISQQSEEERIVQRASSPVDSVESPARVREGSQKSAAPPAEAAIVKSAAIEAFKNSEFAPQTNTLNDQSGHDVITAAPIKPAVTIQAPPILRRQPRHMASEPTPAVAGFFADAQPAVVPGPETNSGDTHSSVCVSSAPTDSLGQIATVSRETTSFAASPNAASAEPNPFASVHSEAIPRTVEIEKLTRPKTSTSALELAQPTSHEPAKQQTLTKELSKASFPADNSSSNLAQTASPISLQSIPSSSVAPSVKPNARSHSEVVHRTVEIGKLARPKVSTSTPAPSRATSQEPAKSQTPTRKFSKESSQASTSSSNLAQDAAPISLQSSASSPVARFVRPSTSRDDTTESQPESNDFRSASTLHSTSPIPATDASLHSMHTGQRASVGSLSNPLPTIHLRRSANWSVKGDGDNIPILTAAETPNYISDVADQKPVASPFAVASETHLPLASAKITNASILSRSTDITLATPQPPSLPPPSSNRQQNATFQSSVKLAGDNTYPQSVQTPLSSQTYANKDAPELVGRILRRYIKPSTRVHNVPTIGQGPENDHIDSHQSLRPEIVTGVNPDRLASVLDQPKPNSFSSGTPVISLSPAESTTSHVPMSLFEPTVRRHSSENDASSLAHQPTNLASHPAGRHEITTPKDNQAYAGSPATLITPSPFTSRTSRAFSEPFKPISFTNSAMVPNVDAKPTLLRSASAHYAGGGVSRSRHVPNSADRLPGFPLTLPALSPSPTLSSKPFSMEFSAIPIQMESPLRVMHSPGINSSSASPTAVSASAHPIARAASDPFPTANLQMLRSPSSRTPSNVYRDSTQLSHRVLRSPASAPAATAQPPNGAATPGLPPNLPSVNSISGAVPSKASSAMVNLPQLAEQVYRLLVRRLASERERRGN